MPADKLKTVNPDKPRRPPSPPRRKNRFNERELARAVRAARTSGANRVDVDPKTGVISLHLSDGTLTPPNEWDAATEKLKTRGR